MRSIELKIVKELGIQNHILYGRSLLLFLLVLLLLLMDFFIIDHHSFRTTGKKYRDSRQENYRFDLRKATTSNKKPSKDTINKTENAVIEEFNTLFVDVGRFLAELSGSVLLNNRYRDAKGIIYPRPKRFNQIETAHHRVGLSVTFTCPPNEAELKEFMARRLENAARAAAARTKGATANSNTGGHEDTTRKSNFSSLLSTCTKSLHTTENDIVQEMKSGDVLDVVLYDGRLQEQQMKEPTPTIPVEAAETLREIDDFLGSTPSRMQTLGEIGSSTPKAHVKVKATR
ncbi:hypothetical protein HDU76_002887 [Blyttiomyces sp. JEL0837]|nr:hypothetical protein HDU76_002887 [Blyttiomyces sp. JEL0837]